MARPTSKGELIAASARGYGKLKEFAASMTEDELEAPFDFPPTRARRKHIGAGTRTCAMS